MLACRCEQLALLHSCFAFFLYGNTGDEMLVYPKVMQVVGSMRSQSNTSIMLQQYGNGIFSHVACAAVHASVCLCCSYCLETIFSCSSASLCRDSPEGKEVSVSTLHCTYRRLLQRPLSCLWSL